MIKVQPQADSRHILYTRTACVPGLVLAKVRAAEADGIQSNAATMVRKGTDQKQPPKAQHV